MTVVSNDRRRTYPGNGVAKTFTGPKATLASHISVYIVDDATQAATLVSTGDYTLSGVGGRRQTTVAMTVAPDEGKTVLILRTVPYEQDADISNQGAYLPEIVELAMDDIVRQTQQLADQSERTIRFPDTMLEFDAEIAGEYTPGNPLVIGADGKSISVGDLVGSGDLTLRGDLASSASGKGGSLVKFLQSGTGAIPRTVMDKGREFVTPEDFGAIGDGVDRAVSAWLIGGTKDRGYANLAAIQAVYPHVSATTDSLDWAAFQQAIKVCQSSGNVLRAFGDYRMNRGLVVSSSMHIEGGGGFRNGAAATPTYVAGARIQATAAVPIMVQFMPTANPGALNYNIFRGFTLDANNLAEKCVVASSCVHCTFENLEGLRCTDTGFEFNDGAGYYFYKNWINNLVYNSTGSGAASSSVGFRFRNVSAGAGGCVQNVVGFIRAFASSGCIIGGCDNNEFGSIAGSLYFTSDGPGMLFARNNIVRYAANNVYNQTSTRSNLVQSMSSEVGGINLDGSGGEVEFRAFNYTTGDWWETPSFTMKDVATYPSGMFGLQGATAGNINSLWDCVDFAGGVTQGAALSTIAPYPWHGGSIKAITLCISMSSAVAGNLRIRVRIATPAVGASNTVAGTDEFFTITPNANSGVMTKHTLTLPTPQAISRGDALLIRIDRIGGDGADTHTGIMRMMSAAAHYRSSGPSAAGGGGGPWDVKDPVI